MISQHTRVVVAFAACLILGLAILGRVTPARRSSVKRIQRTYIVAAGGLQLQDFFEGLPKDSRYDARHRAESRQLPKCDATGLWGSILRLLRPTADAQGACCGPGGCNCGTSPNWSQATSQCGNSCGNYNTVVKVTPFNPNSGTKFDGTTSCCGQTCNETTCNVPCNSNTPCQGSPTPCCNLSTNTCVTCLPDNSGCSGSKPYCNTSAANGAGA